jgi:nucleotide-sensitive chloride channel 1A
MSTTGRGFQIEYPSITLHAISRTNAEPSIYCQLDDNVGHENNTADENDDVTEIRELCIFPQSESARTSVNFSESYMYS